MVPWLKCTALNALFLACLAAGTWAVESLVASFVVLHWRGITADPLGRFFFAISVLWWAYQVAFDGPIDVDEFKTEARK